MDKYEYKLKLDQMRTLTAENRYQEAAEIADTINWHKIKNVNALIKAGEIYEKTGRYEESKEILLMAYDRSPIGRMIIYRLAEVAIKTENYDEAKDYYQEFVEIAPHDNLKYVLKYKICKAQGDNLQTLIAILEELKEQEYSEEWAYELACLYHKAGMSDKCIEACDELILWFGDGPYVEHALELKMLYQPLTRQQEEKYRQFRLKKEGIVEVHPDEELESGEIISEPVQIPKVKLSPERFNTQNLQEELQKSMQQIMEATEKEAVADSMDNIKKLVEEIPYLQIPKEELSEEPTAEQHIETDAEIDDSLKVDFKEYLAEDYDGQMSLYVPEQRGSEPQVSGQMSIEDVLAEWEKTKRAAETALQAAEQRKLEAAKARALQEAGDIMERLADVIPKLDSGLTPKDLLEEQYLAGQPIADDKAAQMVANMNQILQQEIDRLSNENAQMDEQIASAGIGMTDAFASAEPVLEEPADVPEFTEPVEEDLDYEIAAGMTEIMADAEEFALDDTQIETEETIMASGDMEITPEETIMSSGNMEITPEDTGIEPEEQGFLNGAGASAFGFAEPVESPEEMAAVEERVPLDADAENALLEQVIKSMVAGTGSAEMKQPQKILPEIAEPDEDIRQQAITELSEEQKELFAYFLPIKGMEKQICQAMTGAAGRLMAGKSASTGNMIIQGGQGSGKTELATSMIKALQREIGKPAGRVGRIEASALNKKDAAALLEKVAGGCLIIQNAGGISREMAGKLSKLLEEDTSGILVIIEDTRKGIGKALSRDAGFAARFSEKITIPVFTNDELVDFAKSYAKDQGYTIDEMGVLALYNSISNIQKPDEATTPSEVKEIVNQAIEKEQRRGLKKAFSIITSRRYDEDDYIILHEKDFEF